jgi:hypothetical protein
MVDELVYELYGLMSKERKKIKSCGSPLRPSLAAIIPCLCELCGSIHIERASIGSLLER